MERSWVGLRPANVDPSVLFSRFTTQPPLVPLVESARARTGVSCSCGLSRILCQRSPPIRGPRRVCPKLQAEMAGWVNWSTQVLERSGLFKSLGKFHIFRLCEADSLRSHSWRPLSIASVSLAGPPNLCFTTDPRSPNLCAGVLAKMLCLPITTGFIWMGSLKLHQRPKLRPVKSNHSFLR